MATNFPKGTKVRQILPAPIRGVVERYEADEATGELQVLVISPDADGDGNPDARYFKVDGIEADV
jgi:hypothetical protein